MVDPIPPFVRKLWNEWNIRGLMLLSLSMQAFLIVFAPLRQGAANKLIVMLLWSVYLLADWVANIAVGLISSQENLRQTPSPTSSENSDLLAFWPPFLLLHLGGPDTITAFALEDNELWIRHLLGLVFQAVAAIYCFLLSLPETRLVAPTIMMFLAGTIKYLERTYALYLGSLDRFRDSMLRMPDPGPDYAKLMDEYSSKIDAKLPAKIITIEEPEMEFKAADTDGEINIELNNLEVVQKAYKYFNIFKGLIVDLNFSFNDRKESREFFKRLIPKDVLSVIEVEFNLIYDVFHTKIQVVRTVLGYITWLTSFVLVVASFTVFNLHVEKQFYDDFDVKITYILFGGAIGLDALAFFMRIFSYWTFAFIQISEHDSKFTSCIKSSITHFLSWFPDFKKPRWQECQKHLDGPTHKVLATPLLFRRWSGHLSGYNLIRYCIKVGPIRIHRATNCMQGALAKIIHGLGIYKFIQAVKNAMSMVNEPVGIQFLGFIRGHVSHCLVYSCGEIIQYLDRRLTEVVHFLGIDSIQVPGFIDEIKYVSHEPLPEKLWEFILDQLKEKSKVVFHSKDPEVARKISLFRGDGVLQDEAYRAICNKFIPYLTDVAYDESLMLWHIATELLYFTEDNQMITGEKYIPHYDFSKLLSDYMLYLMIMKPSILSLAAGIGKLRFLDTCEEVKRFLKRKDLGPLGNREKTACVKILGVSTHVAPVLVKGDRSKSVLFDASMLAKELKKLEQVKRWELLSKIWVELLSYAAINCDAWTHVQQISKGGELITFVWLLMTHLGLGDQFQNSKGTSRAKLIVSK